MADIQAMLASLQALHPRAIDLSLDRIVDLLDRLGRPQDRLPPVIHVAGTNGKGSTVAFLRAMLEADGKRVHVYTSPHLVRFNERIRIGAAGGGQLVSDERLAEAIAHVQAVNDGHAVTYFEATTAIAIHLFADAEAWAPRIEQGLDVLKEHAIKGYQGSAGYMPAKGGRTDLSDEEVANAVDYMVSESQ